MKSAMSTNSKGKLVRKPIGVLTMNKKGSWILKWGVPIVVILSLFLILQNTGVIGNICEVTAQDEARASEDSGAGLIASFVVWIKKFVLLCQVIGEDRNIFERGYDKTRDFLGFNEDIYDFIPDLLVGALIVVWIRLVFFVAALENRLKFEKSRFKDRGMTRGKAMLMNSWLGIIGGSWWKVIPIAIGYAITMQIPLLNSFMKIVTFEPLLGLNDSAFWWNAIIKSFILAFYIGFAPSAIQAYSRYKLKKGYEEAIIRERYRGKIVDALGSNR